MPTRRGRRRREEQERRRVFHLFGLLPTELRLQIWAYTWEPRTISLYLCLKDENNFLRPGSEKQLPASGYVNSESRRHTLQHYKRCFAHQDKSGFRWFNFGLDTLCLATSPSSLNMLDPSELSQIQWLIAPGSSYSIDGAVVPCSDTWPNPVTESFDSAQIKSLMEKKYPSLKEVTIIIRSWYMRKPGPGLPLEDCYFFEEAWHAFKGWGHMRTTYINGLKVRHSPVGRKTYRERYCRQLSRLDVDCLVETIAALLD